jgi:hypothetical protein
MKKRELIKLIKDSVREAYYETIPMKSESKLPSNDFNFSESSEETKLKIRNLIIRLSQKRDDIEYNINDYTISLQSSERKMYNGNNSNLNKLYFHLEIIKEVGYNINCNNRRVLIKDVTLYDEMLPKIKETFDNINLDNFNELYSSIMKDNGLNRDSNLDELLANF